VKVQHGATPVSGIEASHDRAAARKGEIVLLLFRGDRERI
jgi:hypothetical protein